MGGAIAGALGGEAAVPAEWVEAVSTGSRLDLRAGGLAMAAVAEEIFAADEKAFQARVGRMGSLSGSTQAVAR